MPAIETAAMPKVAGKARSYDTRLSLFDVPTCGDGGQQQDYGWVSLSYASPPPRPARRGDHEGRLIMKSSRIFL